MLDFKGAARLRSPQFSRMNSPFILLGLLVLAATIWGSFLPARRIASGGSITTRRVIFIGSLFAVALGLGLVLWVPEHVSRANSSPAGVIGILLLWLSGGLLAAMGIGGFLGAWFARPKSRSPSPEP